ncbi:MAG TPA: glutamate--tRNA ligase [Gemmataceae bacterium]|nr:glutamate--tRNA ligase [Gemmataceae bacterium]
MTIRTRFAPSPTGYLHIGGVRTALFNWLLARRLGGQFILRIDDTDAERNRPEALQPILDGFRWLGITWDEGPEVGGPHGPYFQSQRKHLYREAALRLLAEGKAYPCYRTREELDAERKEAEKAKKNYIHRGPHREAAPAECRRLYEQKPGALRFKVSPGRVVVVDDLICGPVRVKTDDMGDPVILRPDGSPLYNFATVIDDVGLKITHVIRAKEHLSNTPIQVLFYEALGYDLPKFAHVPVVNAPASSKKLSKRDAKKFMTTEIVTKLRAVHAVPESWADEQIMNQETLNPVMVAFYETLGYLPASLVNYFGRLGWSLDDKTEIIPLDDMIKNFGLERVNNSPASFDPEKLHWLAGEYMRMLSLEAKVEGVLPFLRRAGLVTDPVDAATQNKVRQVVLACGDRLKVFSDVFLYASFLFKDPVYDPQAVEKRLKKEGAGELLQAAREVLRATNLFEPAALEARIKEFCEQRKIKPGDVNHVLRVAVSGVMVGPGVFEMLAILGKDEVRRRITRALSMI